MIWYDYIACFFAGAFLANAVPHFVHGISGDRFPTPFARPPGKGLSSALLNMVWALVNMVCGCALFRAEHLFSAGTSALIVAFLGVAALGIGLSVRFKHKYTA